MQYRWNRMFLVALSAVLCTAPWLLTACTPSPSTPPPAQPKDNAKAAPAPAAATPPPVQATAVTPGVDEFGVPTGDTPPPAPKGYASAGEVKAAVFMGQVAVVDRDGPDPASIGVTVTKDIEYGKVGERALQLDLYTPTGLTKPAPALIFIHGGGWKSGNRHDYHCYCLPFAKRGYVVATISYRFAQDAPYPACVQDAKCAVRWMRANAAANHVDPNRIVVLGGSAGGYLSLMVGYTAGVPELEGDGGNPGVSSAVQAVVDLYGPTDLAAPEAQKASEVTGLLATTFDKNPDLFTKASPLTYVKPGIPPTLILHGTIDETVQIGQSDRLADKLKEVGAPYQYERFEGWPHTMDLAKDVNTRCQWFIIHFLKKHLPDTP